MTLLISMCRKVLKEGSWGRLAFKLNFFYLAVSEDKSNLKKVTQNERNKQYFEIERGSDGASFNKIKTVISKGKQHL